MPRGKSAAEGDTYTAANGYHYTKQNGKFRLTHHIVMEEKLGRPLATDEMVKFKDKDRKNRDPENLYVIKTKTASVRSRIAKIDARISELQAERSQLTARLNG